MPSLRLGLGLDIISSNVNLPPWALSPYFALPERGIDLMVGQASTIYGDTLINVPVPIPETFTVDYTCDIGTQTGNNFSVTPITDNIGSHALTILFKLGDIEIGTFETTLEVHAASAEAGTIKVMLLGDSITKLGADYEGAKINALLTPTIEFIGTQDDTVIKHEGYSGYNWGSFVLTGSPYFKAGVLNIPAFFADNSLATPDLIKIRLGVNDCFGWTQYQNTPDFINTYILDYAKELIDALLAFDANVKIAVSLITSCQSKTVSWNANYDEATYNQNLYIQLTHRLNAAYVTEFDNGAYDARVSVINEMIYLDRSAGYPDDNAVHPNQTGYEQLATGVALALNALQSKVVAPTVVTASWVNDYAQIGFTDNSAGVCQHEIWESMAGGDYALVTTLAPGVTSYNNYTYQGVSMAFKVRARYAGYHSDYCTPVTLVTLFTLKVDMSTPSTLTLNQIYNNANVTVIWGDGASDLQAPGLHNNVAHTYTVAQNPYFLQFSCAVDKFIYLLTGANTKLYGDLSKWITGATMTTLSIAGGSFTGIPRGSLITKTVFGAQTNPIPTAEVDAWLAFANAYYGANTPAVNTAIYLHNLPIGIPTGGANNADYLGIIAKFAAAGKTLDLRIRTS